MRTTLQIDDDVLDTARSLAEAENCTVGEVVSRLARKGLTLKPQEMAESGFPVFAISADAPPITREMVQRAEEED